MCTKLKTDKVDNTKPEPTIDENNEKVAGNYVHETKNMS